jgi:uncharacterized protein with HEPN domain
VKRSVTLRLHDILEAIEGIGSTAMGMTFAENQQSWQVRRAVERGIEIISEASRQVTDELKQRYPHIFWREIAGIGNLLRHEYGRIDDLIMWRVVQRYLPELKMVVVEMLNRRAPSGPEP